jgi:phage terminase Nu1 subunit (DNA packaging protein)
MAKVARKTATAFPSHVGAGVLARLLSTNERTITRLIANGVLRKSAGGFDVIESFASYLAYREGLIAKQHGQGAYGEGRAKLITERAIMARLQRERMEGSMIGAEEVTERWSQTCSAVKTRFLASPSKLARQLAETSSPAECQRILRDEAHENLEALARGAFIPKVTR